MAKIIIAILLLFIKQNLSYKSNYIIINGNNGTIFPGISQTFYLDYLKETQFNLNTQNNDS